MGEFSTFLMLAGWLTKKYLIISRYRPGHMNLTVSNLKKSLPALAPYFKKVTITEGFPSPGPNVPNVPLSEKLNSSLAQKSLRREFLTLS